MSRKIITKTILLVSFVSLFTDIASEMLYPVMPIYLKSIGFSVLLIGILEGIAEATAGFSKGYFGQWSDRKGVRLPFIQWGYFLSAISKPLFAIFTFPIWVFFARTLDRLGKGIRTSARDALLSSEATPETKGKVFGFHRALDTTGAAIGPLLALAFLYFFPEKYTWLFVIALGPGLIAITLTFFIKEKKQKPVESNSRKGFFHFLGYWKNASSGYKKLIIGLLLFTLFNSSDAFLLLKVKSDGFSDVVVIGCYILYNLAYALLSYPLGAIADKIGMKKILIFGMFIFGIVYFFMGFASTLLQFVLLFVLYAVYAACSEGISKAWISNLSKKEETATAIGFYNSFSSIFTMMASGIGGLIWYLFSPGTMFVMSAFAVILVAVYLLIVKIETKS